MSVYTLNTVPLSTYGIVAGHGAGSNIAVQGCFDMPERTGACFHSWGDVESVEPWVLSDEIFFKGRDIIFSGSIIGTISVINGFLKSLYTAIGAFTGLVTFATTYGSFSVYVKTVTPEMLNGGAKITITFREPVVTLTGTLPAIGSSNYTIDSIPFISFGLYLSKAEALHDLPELKEQQFTKYGSEGYQITKRKNKTLDFNGFIIGSSLVDFQNKIKALYMIFSSAGTRTINLDNRVSVVCFATSGFNVDNVIFYTGMIANFHISLMVTTITYS